MKLCRYFSFWLWISAATGHERVKILHLVKNYKTNKKKRAFYFCGILAAEAKAVHNNVFYAQLAIMSVNSEIQKDLAKHYMDTHPNAEQHGWGTKNHPSRCYSGFGFHRVFIVNVTGERNGDSLDTNSGCECYRFARWMVDLVNSCFFFLSSTSWLELPTRTVQFSFVALVLDICYWFSDNC